MPRRSVPSYRFHKPSGQAVVTVRTQCGVRRDIYLGVYNSPESRAEYGRVIAELATDPANGPSPAGSAGVRTLAPTVDEVLLAFWKHAERHYRTPDQKPTTEVEEIRRSIIPLRRLYGHTPAGQFGPLGLEAVRREMIAAGWCRTLINRRIDRVKRVFKWATSQELVAPSVYQAIRTLPGLRRGRTDARESEPVKPVDPAHVAATLPFLPRHLRCMVELQQLTGMRPGEVCRLRLGEVERTGEVWVYRPGQHKTAHRGTTRTVHLGPRAQTAVAAFLRGDHPPPSGWGYVQLDDPHQRNARLVMADSYQDAGRVRDAALLRDTARDVVLVGGCVIDPAATLFCPFSAREDRLRDARAKRKTKVPPSQVSRRRAKPQLTPASEYTPHTYAHAVRVAAGKAGAPHWHPNQLRHTFGTEVRKVHGLEAAQVLLGHARADVTQVYAERDTALAAKVAAEIG